MRSPSLFLALVGVLYVSYSDAACGYKSCPAFKSNMTNVHLVPHSHDDVGWLKTVEQYYYGSRNNIQHAGVQYILDSVIQELLKDAKRRFIYAESAFFFKWYNQQTLDVQKSVKKLVEEGRLEFVGGAWSMNDEGAAHYQSVIDQFSLGLKQLATTFGTCGRPRIGWQIDPFGHSREQASIFAQMGYDGEFFARLDWVEKDTRLNNLTGEMIWRASDEIGESAELFTGVLYNHYSAPPGFCFDNLCSDSPIIDDAGYDNNVKQKVDDFIAHINKMGKYYRTTHLLVPMGGDFNYENANMNFKNMDKLIKYVNERQLMGTKINVFYSTPSCYLDAVHNILQTWPNKTQDFFPYSSDWHTYWTGYYSSRPTQKRFERDGNHLLQVTRQLSVIANLTDTTTTANLSKLRQVMGIMQHHDAIAGTEKQHVSNDYDRLLYDGMLAAQNTTRSALQKLTNLTAGEFQSCLQLNISECAATRTGANNIVVTLFNPLAQARTQMVRIPVKNETHVVTLGSPTGRQVRSQLVPVPREVLALTHRANDTQFELVFEAFVEKLENYYIKVLPQPRVAEEESVQTPRIPKRFLDINQRPQSERAVGDIIVQNSFVKLTFAASGHLTTVQMNGVVQNIRQDFYYYRGALGNNAEFKNRSSGAYIFRPNGTEILVASKVDIRVIEGPLVKEVHQRFNDWISQVIRIYDFVNRVEFEWLVGPIPINDNFGKEVITRFTSTLNNRDVFYTDSNGREMLRRVVNQREYFKPNVTEKVSSNYYPVTARIALQNEQYRMTLLNDRAQGGTSPKLGTLELMLHRRLLRDDSFGVDEALNETAYGKGLIARGKVYLILSKVADKPTVPERFAQQEIHLPFWPFFSNASRAVSKVLPRLPNFSSLPMAIQVLTLEPHATGERLLRLEYILGRNESSRVTFNLREIFDFLRGEEIRETTLDGNMPLSDMKRFKFHPDGTKPTKVEFYTPRYAPLAAKKSDALSKFSIYMDPMQIRTFILKWK